MRTWGEGGRPREATALAPECRLQLCRAGRPCHPGAGPERGRGKKSLADARARVVAVSGLPRGLFSRDVARGEDGRIAGDADLAWGVWGQREGERPAGGLAVRPRHVPGPRVCSRPTALAVPRPVAPLQ